MPLCADVHVIPALKDNFTYLLVDRATKAAACVDPVAPDKTLLKAKELDVHLTMCLTTHKHWDHAGGNAELKLKANHLTFVGSSYEETPCTTQPVKHKDQFSLGSLTITALHAPCHTLGHMLYYVTRNDAPEDHPILFTGDTLFVGGCGRFFEGNANDMIKNMNMIRELRPDTRLFVGHEYTVSNLRFAQSLEPDRQEVEKKLLEAVASLEQHQPTVPAILAEELTYNPFLRFDDPALMHALGTRSPEATMAECRMRKNNF